MMRCWVWKGCKTHNGYGLKSKGRSRSMLVHRAVYEEIIEPIQKGLQIDHLCRNRACYNPEHLEAVTPKENQRRGCNGPASRTHCPKGHPYKGDNLIVERIRRTGGVARRCKTCKYEVLKKNYEKNKEKRRAYARMNYRRKEQKKGYT